MPPNNPRLFNMALIGAAAGCNNRWPLNPPSQERLAAYQVWATTIDGLIPTITSGPAQNQIFLMLALATATANGRDFISPNSNDYLPDAQTLVDLFNNVNSVLTEIPGQIAMGHVHDNGGGPVLQKQFNIASVVDNINVGPGAYIVTFTRPLELDHCTFWATFDSQNPNEAGVVFVQGGSGGVLNLIRFNVFNNNIERGDFNFGVEGMP
jgi:hypothetical protein